MTENICPRGHNIAQLGRTKGGDCRACSRARVRRWKIANAAKVKTDEQADREAYRRVFGHSLRTYYYRKASSGASAPGGDG